MKTLNEPPARTTWNDAAYDALAEIGKAWPETIRDLDDHLKLAVGLVNKQLPNTYETYGPTILEIGLWAWKNLDEAERTEMLGLLINRQIKYGPNNIQAFGYMGIVIRMVDKIARLTNSATDYEDEMYADAIMDLVGYTAISLMLDADTFKLPVQTLMFGAWEGTDVVVSDSQRQDLYGTREYEPEERIRNQFR